MSKKFNYPDMKKFLDAIWLPGEVRELRMLKVKTYKNGKGYPHSGFFDSPERLIDALSKYQHRNNCSGIYITANPVDEDLIAKRCNRIDSASTGDTTSDNDIISQKFFLVDVDPKRGNRENGISGISSTDNEKALAKKVIDRVVNQLGTPLVFADSGNGYHAWYEISGKTNQEALKKKLEDLAEKHDTKKVSVDTTVHNPSRIFKLYGTMACKGDSTAKRPHRMSKVLQINKERDTKLVLPPIEDETPTEAAKPKKKKQAQQVQAASNIDRRGFNLQEWLMKYNVSIKKIIYEDGNTGYVLEQCLFDPSHEDAVIWDNASGKQAITYFCFHNSCQKYTWHDVREKFEPGYKEKRKSYQEGNTSEKAKKPKKTENGKGWKLPAYFAGDKFIPSIALEMFLAKQKKPLAFIDDYFWKYDKGYWSQITPNTIKADIQKFFGRFQRTNLINEVYNLLQWELYKEDITFNDQWDKICLKNGVYCVSSGELLPHKQDYYFNYQIATPYKKDAARPERWNKFFKEIGFSKSQTLRMQEWFGYALTSHYEFNRRLDKCLYLIGEGSNGKSVILDTLISMLGDDNCVSVEPSFLTSRFGKIQVYGKLANIVTDIKAAVGLEESFKKFVSAEKETADRKHKSALGFRPFAKQIFSANNWLPTKDRSHGFFRRFDVFQFTRIFSEHEQDRGLKRQLQEQELVGILKWSINGLKRLVNNNFLFSSSPEIDAAKQQFKERNQPILTFITEQIQDELNSGKDYIPKYPNENSDYLPCEKLRTDYRSWCMNNGFNEVASNRLGEELKTIGIDKKRLRNKSTKDKHNYYVSTAKFEVIKERLKREHEQDDESTISNNEAKPKPKNDALNFFANVEEKKAAIPDDQRQQMIEESKKNISGASGVND